MRPPACNASAWRTTAASTVEPANPCTNTTTARGDKAGHSRRCSTIPSVVTSVSFRSGPDGTVTVWPPRVPPRVQPHHSVGSYDAVDAVLVRCHAPALLVVLVDLLDPRSVLVDGGGEP